MKLSGMKQNWLAVALIVLAGLGAVAATLSMGMVTGESDAAGIQIPLVLVALLFFVPLLLRGFAWWPWATFAVAAVAVLVSLPFGAALYLAPSAFLVVVAGLLELAAPKAPEAP